ncbi:RNA polymerase sigma factor [Pedobacter sp. AW31-3R]|uniref:RNA polymerase sigma factor n=1 Tax=Pedobacter sp. AW31-3R TaxID=3445781 RepID=UPI003F9EF165
MKNYNSYSDEELLVLFRNGERGAFEIIYQNYWPRLVLHVNNMLKDEDLAQDIVQEVFAWLINNVKELIINSTLKSYLYSAVRFKVFDAIRHEKTRNNYLETIADHIPTSSADADFHLK